MTTESPAAGDSASGAGSNGTLSRDALKATILSDPKMGELVDQGIDWVLNDMCQRAFYSRSRQVAMLADDPDLDRFEYQIFKIMVPHGSAATPGSAHEWLNQQLSELFDRPVRIEHNDDRYGVCLVSITIVDVDAADDVAGANAVAAATAAADLV